MDSTNFQHSNASNVDSQSINTESLQDGAQHSIDANQTDVIDSRELHGVFQAGNVAESNSSVRQDTKHVLPKRMSLPALGYKEVTDPKPPDQVSTGTSCERTTHRLRSAVTAPPVKQQPTTKRHMLRNRMSLPSFSAGFSTLPPINRATSPNSDQSSKGPKVAEQMGPPQGDIPSDTSPNRRYTSITAPAQLHAPQKRVLKKGFSMPSILPTNCSASGTATFEGCQRVIEPEVTLSDDVGTKSTEPFIPIQCYCLRCQIMMRLSKTGDKQLEMWGKYPCFRK